MRFGRHAAGHAVSPTSQALVTRAAIVSGDCKRDDAELLQQFVRSTRKATRRDGEDAGDVEQLWFTISRGPVNVDEQRLQTAAFASPEVWSRLAGSATRPSTNASSSTVPLDTSGSLGSPGPAEQPARPIIPRRTSAPAGRTAAINLAVKRSSVVEVGRTRIQRCSSWWVS